MGVMTLKIEHPGEPRDPAEPEELIAADREALAESFSEAQRAMARNDVASLAAIASSSSRRRARAAVGRHREL
jgi:hypothetical protein